MRLTGYPLPTLFWGPIRGVVRSHVGAPIYPHDHPDEASFRVAVHAAEARLWAACVPEERRGPAMAAFIEQYTQRALW